MVLAVNELFQKQPQEYTRAAVSYLIKLQAETCNFIKKEDLTQLVFCHEFCEFFQNTFSTEHLRETACYVLILVDGHSPLFSM